MRRVILELLSILSSFSTLICCALPAALVSIGAGAALAGVVTAVPQVVWLSEHKVQVFALAGIMLVLAGNSSHRNAPCPADPVQAKSCMLLRRWTAWIFYLSAVMYVTGFLFAFVL